MIWASAFDCCNIVIWDRCNWKSGVLVLDGYKGGAKKALENWESARGRYMCANFVGDICVFQHSMTDSVQKCRTNLPLCTFFQHRPFLLGLLLFLACWGRAPWRWWWCCCCCSCCWCWWWWWSCSRDKITEAVWVTTTLFYTSIIATSHTSREETDTRTNIRAQRHYGKHTDTKVDDFLRSESHWHIF